MNNASISTSTPQAPTGLRLSQFADFMTSCLKAAGDFPPAPAGDDVRISQAKREIEEALRRCAAVDSEQLPVTSGEIHCRFEDVMGSFDMRTGKLVCVKSEKYGTVELCFKANGTVPFAKIKLYEGKLASEADAVLDDAAKLGDEIVRRWSAGPHGRMNAKAHIPLSDSEREQKQKDNE